MLVCCDFRRLVDLGRPVVQPWRCQPSPPRNLLLCIELLGGILGSHDIPWVGDELSWAWVKTEIKKTVFFGLNSPMFFDFKISQGGFWVFTPFLIVFTDVLLSWKMLKHVEISGAVTILTYWGDPGSGSGSVPWKHLPQVWPKSSVLTSGRGSCVGSFGSWCSMIFLAFLGSYKSYESYIEFCLLILVIFWLYFGYFMLFHFLNFWMCPSLRSLYIEMIH